MEWWSDGVMKDWGNGVMEHWSTGKECSEK
jgi:hypothetical protein